MLRYLDNGVSGTGSSAVCYAKHFEVLLALQRNSIIVIVLVKFEVNRKVYTGSNKIFGPPIYFVETVKVFQLPM